MKTNLWLAVTDAMREPGVRRCPSKIYLIESSKRANDWPLTCHTIAQCNTITATASV